MVKITVFILKRQFFLNYPFLGAGWKTLFSWVLGALESIALARKQWRSKTSLWVASNRAQPGRGPEEEKAFPFVTTRADGRYRLPYDHWHSRLCVQCWWTSVLEGEISEWIVLGRQGRISLWSISPIPQEEMYWRHGGVPTASTAILSTVH